MCVYALLDSLLHYSITACAFFQWLSNATQGVYQLLASLYPSVCVYLGCIIHQSIMSLLRLGPVHSISSPCSISLSSSSCIHHGWISLSKQSLTHIHHFVFLYIIITTTITMTICVCVCALWASICHPSYNTQAIYPPTQSDLMLWESIFCCIVWCISLFYSSPSLCFMQCPGFIDYSPFSSQCVQSSTGISLTPLSISHSASSHHY